MCTCWCSAVHNELGLARYISTPFNDHSDSMHEMAGDSATSTRRSSAYVSSSSSLDAMFTRWLISVVSWCGLNSIWNVAFDFDFDFDFDLFCPNSIQLDADSSGSCFTTHRRHFGVFIFRTKAPVGMVVVIGLDWIGLLGVGLDSSLGLVGFHLISIFF